MKKLKIKEGTSKFLLVMLSFTLLVIFGTVDSNAAIITVTSEANSGEGSLRQAIVKAKTGDTIVFAPNVTKIILTSGRIDINKNLTIDGSSGDSRVTISADTIFCFNSTSSYIKNLILIHSKVLLLEKSPLIPNEAISPGVRATFINCGSYGRDSNGVIGDPWNPNRKGFIPNRGWVAFYNVVDTFVFLAMQKRNFTSRVCIDDSTTTLQDKFVCAALRNVDIIPSGCFDSDGWIFNLFNTFEYEMRKNKYTVGITFNCSSRFRWEWSAIFVGACLLEAYRGAGKKVSPLLKALHNYQGSVQNLLNRLADNKLAVEVDFPEVGSIFFRKKYNAEGLGNHIGIVIEVDTVNQKFVTVEGNTAKDERGFGVVVREYSFNTICSFDLPPLRKRSVRIVNSNMRFLQLVDNRK